MKTSVSNLAWGAGFSPAIARELAAAGIDGVELAPTAIWPNIDQVSAAEVTAEAERWRDAGLPVVAIQSLLFGCPDVNLFDRASWGSLRARLSGMAEVAHGLGAGVAVFGSPKNRIRGSLSLADANEVAREFFASLTPVFAESGVVLTLEPNAPVYGADYLTDYPDCVVLADMVGSGNVGVQIDTGCLYLVDSDPVAALNLREPDHVHISAPQLDPLPGPVDHAAFSTALVESGYDGWITMEMKRTDEDVLLSCIEWLSATYGVGRA